MYGLDCKYDREVRKRGKGSLARSSRERSCPGVSGRPNADNAPMTPVTSTCSPASSPGFFHLAIPPSHLFGGQVTEPEDDFAAVPFGPRQPQPNTYGPENHPSFHKAETMNRGSFTSGFTLGVSRDADSTIIHQKPCDQALESTSSLWNRAYGAFAQPKGVPSSNPLSTLQGNFQSVAYMPLCSSCQTNISTQLYPGPIMWLPPPSHHYPPPEYGSLLAEEGVYSTMFPTISIDPVGR